VTATAALARHRLRPVPWAWLAVFAAGWSLLAHVLATGATDPGEGVTRFRLLVFLLGLGAAVLTAPETDPARGALMAAPVPLWRAMALRLAVWLALGTVPVLVLAVLLDGSGGWTAADLARATLPGFLLVSAAGFLAARATSALAGGAVAGAAVAALGLAGRVWPELPLQLGSVPGAPHWRTSRALMVAVGLLLVVLTLFLEHRAGRRPGLPRRRAVAPWARPAAGSRARP
jgi:hypothetical protein